MEVYMRTANRTLLILVFLLLSISFPILSQDMDEIKKNIDDWNNQLSEAMLKGDSEIILSFYADDIISLPSYHTMMEGKDALRNALMMDANSGNKFTKFQMTSKKLLSEGNLLVDIGTYELSMDIQGMDQPYNDQGKYVTIYEKQDDGNWKIKVDTWNSDNNPWMDSEDME
jgi:ketosteroid isomerase-like protein